MKLENVRARMFDTHRLECLALHVTARYLNTGWLKKQKEMKLDWWDATRSETLYLNLQRTRMKSYRFKIC